MKIVLSKDAPKGAKLAGTFGDLSFDAGDAKSFETDNVALALEADKHPFFEVEGVDATVSKSELNALAKKEAELLKVQQEVRDYEASRLPWEETKIVPRTVAELEADEPEQGRVETPNVEAPAPRQSTNGGKE
jgi:hypothetical protein